MRALERLDAYCRARELAVDVYLLTRELPLARHVSLADQISRACLSIPANIAEAYALGTKPQLVRGLRIAFGSAAELRTHLWIARRVGALSADARVEGVEAAAERVLGLLIGLLKRYGARVGQ